MKTLKIITAIVLLVSCSTDDAPVDQESLLPSLTTTGENTFGCLVDGKYFRPRDGRITVNSDNKGLRVVRTENQNLEFHVYDRKSDNGGSLFIHLENFYTEGEGTYHFEEATGLRGIDGPNHNYIYGRFWNGSQYITYLSSVTGELSITNVDTLTVGKRIFSGEFKATLKNENDTLNIDLGRFDLNTQTLSNTTFN